MSRIGRVAAWAFAGCLALLSLEVFAAQAPTLASPATGAITFPTSCTESAHKKFLRGVEALHSFWYPVALEEFREAARFDPDCAMGYWGEAMAHTHPLWGDPQDTQAGRAVLAELARIAGPSSATERERRWIEAVRLLYGEEDQAHRDRAYAAAMERIHRDYPDDEEAALFYALALLGTARTEQGAGERIRMKAGAIASEVYRRHPNHPGAAHYVIHAYDDPEHAHQALDAARRYAGLAPDAPHALHMPSHIFLQLGMWDEAAASNEKAWAASQEWVRRRNLPAGRLDYHSLHWLTYVYLQQGRYEEAQARLSTMRRSLAGVDARNDDPRSLVFASLTYGQTAAAFLAETKRWTEADSLLSARSGPAAEEPTELPERFRPYAALARMPETFARGMAAAATGSDEAQRAVSSLRRFRDRYETSPEPSIARAAVVAGIQAFLIEGRTQAAAGGLEKAIHLLRGAAEAESRMPPPSGPPAVITPSHELLGEALLRADRPGEAAAAFALSLDRHPNRAASLLGAARAADERGDARTAAGYYATLAVQWKRADDGLPALVEARSYGEKTPGSVAGGPREDGLQ